MTRISSAQLHDSAVAHLQRASVAMARAQEQAATNRRLLRPSDDPVAFRQAVLLRDAIGELEQYARNADVADRITKVADDAIGTAADVLIRAKEIAIGASNTAVGAGERVAMAQEIEQIAKHLVSVANTKIGDAYLWTPAPPRSRSAAAARYRSASMARRALVPPSPPWPHYTPI